MIFLGDPELLKQSEGYAGNGSIPGYIQLAIVPDEKNLAKLNACAAHEFHHNVLFYNAKWNFMNVSVGQYLAVEGLAESFAESMFGKEFIGPWVTNVDNEGLEKAREIIAPALSIKGFMQARMYMYGDHPMVPEAKSLGIPYCGGYAVGYHAVQSYMKKKHVTVAEATRVDGEEIMRESGYFEL